ncbi:toxin-antitoxin system HicB family antitoxin [Crateriforma conspicua]|uniref:HicB family protein n=1 Tax=Crateriforma conspicua TaxID=2527996 RepID=A0A5C6G209_9PLAN|nr:toxin-antitoxin system HicB family antitoxin [Crateriforma conspicua]TWU67698.1 HicB family protein [Crateriforma conspicua]
MPSSSPSHNSAPARRNLNGKNAVDAEGRPLRYASDPDPDKPQPESVRLNLGPIDTDLPVEERPGEALRLAAEAFSQTGDWVVLFRELLGTEGVCRKLFPHPDQMRYFETTDPYIEIQEMIAALRSQEVGKGGASEPERMITIRIPKSLHEALRMEADEQNLSINKLCITKLLQRLDARHVPLQRGRRRGRRPGPQARPQNRQKDDTPRRSKEPQLTRHSTAKDAATEKPESLSSVNFRPPASGDWSQRGGIDQ